jgi:hypothetical protein
MLRAVAWVVTQARELKKSHPAWPVLVAVGAGIAVVWPATFLYARHVELKGDWYPAAGSASGAWLCAVLIGVTIWEYVQITRGKRSSSILPRERDKSWRQEWRMAAVLVIGVLLGWWIFK